MLIQLNRWLIERYRRRETCVIVVDEAQDLSAELLEEIRLLTNLETSSEKLVQIILSGQPEFEEKLRQPELRQLRQRISLWCRTQPLTAEQTADYITERLLIAGTKERLFPPESILAIHRASQGIPRIINLVCEHLLIVGYVAQVRSIPPAAVEEVIRDLGLEFEPMSMRRLSGESNYAPILAHDASVRRPNG
jgi:type II secretory pathway predicted ATPase ExeA